LCHSRENGNPEIKKMKFMSNKNKDKQESQETPKDAPSPQAPQNAQPLQKDIERLQAENKELLDKFQRLGADYANYQKRVPKQIADSVDYEKRQIIKSLLASMDNFAHALAGAKTARGPEALQSVIDGIQFVYDHMFDSLKTHGVEKIASVGRPFEPGKHEAMMQRAEPDKPDNIVLEEFQTGYTLGGYVLRPARVAINKLPAQPVSPLETEETTDTENENDNNKPGA
jgi:molecular chaperone GrpE